MAHTHAFLLEQLTTYRDANSASTNPDSLPIDDANYEIGYAEALDDAHTELTISVANAGNLIRINSATSPADAYDVGYQAALSDVAIILNTGTLPGISA
jgi:hypothetical protein